MDKLGNHSADGRFELAKVAMGELEADLAILSGNIVNVYTGEIINNQTVLIKGRRIAYVGPDSSRNTGSHTQTIDAAGKFLIPGLIDGHTHMDYLCSSRELTRQGIKSGTTSIITETAEIAFRLGFYGIQEYIKSTRGLPVKFWFTLPPMGTISPLAANSVLSPDEIKRLLARPDFVGLGEIYWGAAITDEPRLLNIIRAVLKSGKKLEGHAAGATGNKLQAYTCLGISSDHEPINPAETLARLRLGLTTMIREGEVRQDLAGVAAIKDYPVDFHHLVLATDGVGPSFLADHGFMDYVVQKAINVGFPPVCAIQMATLNVAEHFNLQDQIGGIAPGRYADIVAVPSLSRIKPEMVVSNGQIVFSANEIRCQLRQYHFPDSLYSTIQLPFECKSANFEVAVNDISSSVRVRTLDQVTSILTREAILELPVINNRVQTDLDRDIVKIALIEYIRTGGKTFTGFIRGLGLKRGAVATSTCWDSADLAVAGANEEDMALAVNRLRELGGGTIVCDRGQILAEVSFPVCGIISTERTEILAAGLKSVQSAAAGLGCKSPDIRTTLSVLPTPAIPYLRICESGLFDVKSNRPVEMIL